MKVTCVVCDNVIEVDDFDKGTFQERYYCDEKCKQIKLRPYNKQSKIVINCKFCDKKVYTTSRLLFDENKIYCSHKCSSDDRKIIDNRICENCGVEYLGKSLRDNLRFCSRKCYREFKDKEHTKEFICEYCSIHFELKGIKYYKNFRNGNNITRKYCSKQCTDLARIGKFTDNESPRWMGGLTSLQDIIRKSVDYKKLRKLCFERDNYQSVLSGKNGKLVHHHIMSYAKIIEKNNITKENWRQFKHILFDLDNVVTLKSKEHKLFHSIYGKVASPDDFWKFILENTNQAMEVI